MLARNRGSLSSHSAAIQLFTALAKSGAQVFGKQQLHAVQAIGDRDARVERIERVPAQ